MNVFILVLLTVLLAINTNALSKGNYNYIFPPLEKSVHKKASYSKSDYSVETPEADNIYNTNGYPYPDNQAMSASYGGRINDSNLRYDDPIIRIKYFSQDNRSDNFDRNTNH